MIGPAFADEIRAAGLDGLPFTWGADGSLAFDPSLTPDQITAIRAAVAAHNPAAPRQDAALLDELLLRAKPLLALALALSNEALGPLAGSTTGYTRAQIRARFLAAYKTL